jgi:hypothetical protein
MFNVIKVLIRHRPDCGYCATYLYLVWALRMRCLAPGCANYLVIPLRPSQPYTAQIIMVKVPCVPRDKPGCKRFKRQPVPESDMPRLLHLMKDYVKNTGLELAFDMGEYKDIPKTHAVRAACLVLTHIVYIYIYIYSLFIYIIQ